MSFAHINNGNGGYASLPVKTGYNSNPNKHDGNWINWFSDPVCITNFKDIDNISYKFMVESNPYAEPRDFTFIMKIGAVEINIILEQDGWNENDVITNAQYSQTFRLPPSGGCIEIPIDIEMSGYLGFSSNKKEINKDWIEDAIVSFAHANNGDGGYANLPVKTASYSSPKHNGNWINWFPSPVIDLLTANNFNFKDICNISYWFRISANDSADPRSFTFVTYVGVDAIAVTVEQDGCYLEEMANTAKFKQSLNVSSLGGEFSADMISGFAKGKVGVSTVTRLYNWEFPDWISDPQLTFAHKYNGKIAYASLPLKYANYGNYKLNGNWINWFPDPSCNSNYNDVDDMAMSFTVEANPSTEPRSFTALVCVGLEVVAITVNQYGAGQDPKPEPEMVTVTFDGNGATGGKVPAVWTGEKGKGLLTIPSAGTLVKSGYEFVEWNTSPDGSGRSVAIDSVWTINGNLTLYAVWKKVAQEPPQEEKPTPAEPEPTPTPTPTPTPEKPMPAEPEPAPEPTPEPVTPTYATRLDEVEWDSPFADAGAGKLKLTYDGFLMDNEGVKGLVTLTVTGTAAKPKLTAKVTTAGGNQTLKATGWTPNGDGMFETAVRAKGREMELTVGGGVASGTLGGMDVLLARNRAADKSGQASVAPFAGDYTVSVEGDTTAGYLRLSAKTVKGAVTVKGALSDGSAVSAKSTMLDFGLGDGAMCVPVFAARKGGRTLGALLWICRDGRVEDDGVAVPRLGAGSGGELLSVGGARFSPSAVEGARTVVVGDLPCHFDRKAGEIDAVAEASPDGLAVTVSKGRIAVPKATTPRKGRDGAYEYSGPTDAGLKLTCKAATGELGGSFKLYYDWEAANGRIQHKAVTAKVQGAAAGGRFIGFATVPQPNPALKKTQKVVTMAFTVE